MHRFRGLQAATQLTRSLVRLTATGALALAAGSCLDDRPLTPAASSIAALVVAAERAAIAPDLGLTTARVVLRPEGIVGDSVVATGSWTGDSAIVQTPVSVASTSQFFDVAVGVVNARGDTLLRGTARVRLYSLFTVSTRIPLTYSGPDAQLASLQVTPRDTVVAGGGSFTARVTGADSAGHAISPIVVSWSSRDTTLFAVTATGQVTAAAKAGTAYIVATAINGKSDSTTITVRTGVTSTVVTPRLGTLHSLGATQALVATAFAGSTATSGAFAWTSRNSAVATVSASGVVTAVGNGAAYVVAVEAAGTKDSSLITVHQDVASLVIAPAAAAVALGQTKQFTATATDAGGAAVTNLAAADFTWETSDHAVATVSPTGLATSHAIGGAINVTVTAGGKTATAQLTVTSTIARIAITPDTTQFDAIGRTRVITATAYDASNAVVSVGSFAWSSTAPGVVSLATATSAGTNTITAIDNGTAFITASAQGVTSPASAISVQQALASLEVKSSTGEPASVAPGGKLRLFARGKDALGVYLRTSVTITSWHSDDADELPVDNTGVVTGTQDEIVIREGVAALGTATSAHITATAAGASGPITSNAEVVTLTSGATKQITWERDTLFLATASVTLHLYVNVPSLAPINAQLTFTPSQGAPIAVAVPIGASEFTVIVGPLASGAYRLTVADANPIVGNRYAGSSIVIIAGATVTQTTRVLPTPR